MKFWKNYFNLWCAKYVTQSKQYDGLETNFFKKKQNMMKYQKYLIEDLKVKLKRVNLIDLNWTYAT